MAVNKITCPECESVLRPAKPVPPGKSVKCPKCGHNFVVPQEDPPARAKPKAKKAEAVPARKKPGDKGAVKKAESPRPDKKSAPRSSDEDEDEGGGLTYGVVQEKQEDEENKPKITYAPDTSIKDLRGPAQAAIMQPTNILTLAGVLGFIGWLALLVVVLIPVLFPIEMDNTILKIDGGLAAASSAQAGPPPEAEPRPDPSAFVVMGINFAMLGLMHWYILIIWLMPIFAGMAYSGVVIMGAVKCQNLESREWGIASSVMAMLPINAAGLIAVVLMLVGFLLNMFVDEDFTFYVSLGLLILICLGEAGAGLWTLLVLMKEEVIDGFEFEPE